MKFPNLVSHFLAHKINNSNTTVFSFLKMHYVDEQTVDADYDQDMKLPFKTHETNSIVINPLTIPGDFTFSLLSPAIFRERKGILSRSFIYASNTLNSIFRPPIFV